ncbi:MAG: transposase [Phycisphaerae bacterium]
MPTAPFALFLTWTTYGTWLPGDKRGYVSNTLKPDGRYETKNNRVSTPYDAESVATYAAAQAAQKYDAVWLTAAQAQVAAQALCAAAQDRDWQIVRAAIMSNHVHVLTTGCPNDAAMVLRIYKGVSSAKISAAHGKAVRWWTHGGSQRYLNDAAGIAAVERYIRDQNRILCEVVDNQVIYRGQ